MPIKKEKLDSIKGYREYQKKVGRLLRSAAQLPLLTHPRKSLRE